jgi:hypothetical protein
MTTQYITSESGLTGTSFYSGYTNFVISNNFTITNPANFMVIQSNNITIDGQMNTLTVTAMNYPGLVGNTGSFSANIKNLNVVICGNTGSLSSNSGWICQSGTSNTTVTNCSSNGIIPPFGGGIFGSGSTGCTGYLCYSTGAIGASAGGIFGFDASNNITSYCYSTGSIASYAGGIYAQGATGCTVNNSYSVGNGSTYSGGIFGPDAFSCSATNTYTTGSGLENNGIFSVGGENNVTNYSFSESINSCDKVPVWKDKNACKILNGLGCIWTDINKCSSHIPWLLNSFNKMLYSPSCQTSKCKTTTTTNGLISLPCNIYEIISVNCKKKVPCKFTINSSTGQMTFKKVKKGRYAIKVINGNKITLPTTGTNISTYYTFSSYNISNYYLHSLYKKKKCKSKCKSSSSSSSSCSSSSSSSSCSSSSSSSSYCNPCALYNKKCYKK